MNIMLFNIVAVGLCGIDAVLIRRPSAIPVPAGNAGEAGDRSKLVRRVLLTVATFCAAMGFIGAMHPSLH